MNSSHPTRDLLVDTVLELLKNEHLSEVTSEEVLAKSGISKGSLYHHFDDFDDLLEVAEVKRFSLLVDATVSKLAEMLSATSEEDFIAALEDFNRSTYGEDYKKIRLIRLKAVTHAGLTDRMKSRLKIEQDRLTMAVADMCQEAQFRGWTSTRFAPKTISVFLQAYTLGLIVNDYTDSPVEENDWLSLLSTILKDVILAQD